MIILKLFNALHVIHLLFWTESHGHLATIPMNIAAVNGTKTHFQCGTDRGNRDMRWQFLKYGSSTSEVLYNGFSLRAMFSQRFSVDKMVGGRCDLIIDSTQIQDAGAYMCEEPVSFRTSSADLTVLGMLLVAIAFYIVLM